MFGQFRREASSILLSALKGYDIEVEAVFTIPVVEKFGDLSTNICFQLAPKLKKSPQELAPLIASKIKPKKLVKRVKAEKGYLNFYLNYPEFTRVLLRSIQVDFGKGEPKDDKIILEHTSANPDGPLHIGHLRNAVVGDTLVKIFSFAGYDIEAHYYLNDMGKQAAKVVWGRRNHRIGKGKEDHATGEIYIKASKEIEEQELDEEVSKILLDYEKGDSKTVEEFGEAVNFCLKGIKETLNRLGINHDEIVWESRFVRDGSVKELIEKLGKTKFAKKDKGALLVDLTSFGIEKEMVLTRSDATSLYLARDLAHHVWKMQRGRGINVWGADHKLMSKQLSAGLSILGINPPEFIIHEFISLPEGSMSTRRGVFVSADQLIDETVQKALEELKSRRPEMDGKVGAQVAEDVGVGAVRFNIARVSPEKSMTFRWEEALDFERQGAPFIQYAYARGRKILSKAGKKDLESQGAERINDNERKLIKIIGRFPEVVEEAARDRKASTMATYSVELSQAFHSFYMTSRVLDSSKEDFRILLVMAALYTLGNAMDILGIKRLEEM